MNIQRLLTGLAALGAFSFAAPALAGNTYSGKMAPPSCGPNGGSLCPPGAPAEEVVPQYYDVPSKTQHIYYAQPTAAPVVTRIIHHVPVPVYGRQHVSETIYAGPWTGPLPGVNCCNRMVAPPVYIPPPPPPPRPSCYRPAFPVCR